MLTRLSTGIDFGTAWVDVCLQAADGTPLVPHQRFGNSLPGFQDFKQLLLETKDACGAAGIDISGEATGMYWLPFFLALATDPELTAHDTHLYLLNPRWVKWYKLCFAEDNKTDPSDAYYIADRVRVNRPNSTWHPDLHALTLRFYTRYRFHLVQALTREKSFFCVYLFLKANAYHRLKPFSDLFGVASRTVLSESPNFEEIATLPVADLDAQLDILSKHHLPDSRAAATKLHQVAAESLPLPVALQQPVQRILDGTLAHIAFLESQVTLVEGWIAAELVHHPAIRQLQTIPGIGPACAAGIGAEIVPVQRFLDGSKFDKRRAQWCPRNLRDAEDAVAKIAGLWWPRMESGNFAAEDRHLAKSGNAYLRYYLIQAADQLRRHAPEYRQFYHRKFTEATKHHHKRALVLTARKSVGLIVGLLHRNQPYRSQEVRRT